MVYASTRRGRDHPRQREALRNASYARSKRTARAYLALAGARYAAPYLGRLGVGALTIPVHLFEELTEHEATLAAERTFLADAG